jgi:hypothetical protein
VQIRNSTPAAGEGILHWARKAVVEMTLNRHQETSNDEGGGV